MAGERDHQSTLAVRYLWYQDVKVGRITYPVVDTDKMRSLTFGLQLEDEPDPADDVDIIIEDSKDNITWTRVPDYKLLPSEDGPQHKVVIPASGAGAPYEYAQTIGVVSHDRFVRLALVGYVVKKSYLIDVTAIMIPEDQAFRKWDPKSLILDGNP